MVLFPVATRGAPASSPPGANCALCSADSPCRLRELLLSCAQLLGVLLVQVNLVLRSIQAELHSLLGLAAVNVIDELNLDFAGHQVSTFLVYDSW